MQNSIADHPTRILITGGSGALGSYVEDCLLERARTYPLEIASLSRQRRSRPGISHYACDFLDSGCINDVMNHFRPDNAILCAWVSTHGQYWNDPVNVDWANATLAFAETFARLGGTFLTFIGSCAEYTWGSLRQIDEQTPELPHSVYGREKLRTTRALTSLRQRGGLDVNCSRVFLPFSERENDERVTSLVIRMLASDAPLHLKCGDVYRDICHTRHLAKAIVDMNLSQVGGLFNLSTGRALHLGYFLAQLATAMGKRKLLTWDPWHGSDSEPRRLYGNREHLPSRFWLPQNPLADVNAFVKERYKHYAQRHRPRLHHRSCR